MNIADSYTLADSNLFLSPKEIFLIAQENKYLQIFQGNFLILSWKMYVECMTH